MLKLIISLVECLVIITALIIGYKWISKSPGDYGAWLTVCGLIFSFLEVFRRYEIHLVKREGIKFPTPGDLIRHRQKFRKLFDEEIHKCRTKRLKQDVIIRHVNRMDSYPDTKEKGKGISSWFRARLLDTYNNGIMVALRFYKLSMSPNGYRYSNHSKGEEGDIEVFLVGKIPFEFIEEVNFDGDDYYNKPHIFCHYKNKGEPYEEIIFCEEIDMGNGHQYYKEVAKYAEVEKNSKNEDLSYHRRIKYRWWPFNK